MKSNEKNTGNNNILPINTDDGENGKPFDLSIIPVSSAKIPYGKWKIFQSEVAPITHWRSHFGNGGYIGIITGKVSGNLEVIDIDVKNDPDKSIHNELTDLLPQKLLDKLIIQTTPNEGYHLIYRCSEIEKNQELAHAEDGQVIIETRGEGGYICHHLKDYQVIQGDFSLVTYNINIPIITTAERETILTLARSLDRKALPQGNKPFEYGEQSINDFNETYNIIDLFVKDAWTVYANDIEKVTLTRPDSNAPYSGYYYRDTRTFISFSSSTAFKVQKPYNHFQVLKILEGGNDYHKTLKLLPIYGYELSNKSDRILADDIAEYLNSQGIKYDTFRQDLIYQEDIISELVYNTIFLDMKKHFGRNIPRSSFEEVIKSSYIQTYNPIEAFIERYKDRHPQCTFEQWLDCLVLKNKNIDRKTVLHFFKKWYVGMIAQALGGEYPNEFFLTLLSIQQGIGKTTLLRKYTIPEELQAYCAEHSLSYNDDFKVLMGQAIMIVDDEMDGRTYEMSQTFKTILSTREITTRRKYDRRISKIQRRCSFAGSGNNLSVIRERSNRRIIPIEIEKIHHEKLLEVDLIDLFMEAYHLYTGGFQYSYQHNDQTMLSQLYEDYVQQSDIDLILDEYLDHPVNWDDEFDISNLDIVTTLSENFPQFSKRINVPTIGKQMIERGFASKRKGKKRTTCYIISKKSRIMEMLNKDAQSWRLRP